MRTLRLRRTAASVRRLMSVLEGGSKCEKGAATSTEDCAESITVWRRELERGREEKPA